MLIVAPISWLYEKELANLFELIDTDSRMQGL